MKKLLLSIAAMLSGALVLQAQTQPTYGYQSFGTFTNALNSTTNLSYIIDCRKQSKVVVAVNSAARGTTNCNWSMLCTRSADGINYDGLAFLISGTSGAATNYLTLTNLDTQGSGFIRINNFQNASTDETMTNSIGYSVKISSP